MAGSPTTKRRTGPLATATFTPNPGKPCMAFCTAKAAATARADEGCRASRQFGTTFRSRPASSNQHVIASPAKLMTLPPYRSISPIKASYTRVDAPRQFFDAATRAKLLREPLGEGCEAGDVGHNAAPSTRSGEVFPHASARRRSWGRYVVSGLSMMPAWIPKGWAEPSDYSRLFLIVIRTKNRERLEGINNLV